MPAPGNELPHARSERVFTPALTAFLSAVALILLFALNQRLPSPDLQGAIDLLADGDLDGSERDRMLRRLLADAKEATAPDERWAGLLAALALEDRRAFQAMQATFGRGPVPSVVPPPAERERLHLGDPLLGSVLAAFAAEAANEPQAAIAAWTRAQVQARLARRPFARELAEASLARLGQPPTRR